MRLLLRFCSCLLLCCAPGVVFAGDSKVIVEVGKSRVTGEALSARLRALPDYQLESLGSDPKQVKQAFVDRVVVPELLFAEEARRRKLDETLPFRIAAREVLRGALEREVRTQLRETRPVSDEEVERYYEKHRAQFEKPERFRLFRILVKSEDEARQVLEQARKADLVAWRELARKHSTDTATRERGGDLGFVQPDGSTDVPRVRVAPALYEAAREVENGALIPEPVQEDEAFAIVWRRGSLDATQGGLERHGARIKRLLEEDHVREALAKLTAARSNVKTSNVALLEELRLPAFGSADAKAPVRITKPNASARPAVESTPSGAR